MHFHRHAGLDQLEHHFRAEVLQLVGGRHREVAFLPARPVAEVGRAAVAAAVPNAFVRVDRIGGRVLGLLEVDVVEDEELRLGSPIGDVGDAGLAQVAFGLEGDVARVAAVGLVGQRIKHIAGQAQGRHDAHRVDNGRPRIGEEQHIALVDGLEAADARAIEADALGENVGGQLADGGAEVLPGAGQIDELEIDDLQPLLGGEIDNFLRGRETLCCLFCSHALLLVLITDVNPMQPGRNVRRPSPKAGRPAPGRKTTERCCTRR